jgi:hypothetical protein
MKLFGRKGKETDPGPPEPLVVEGTGVKDFGPCSCCGDNSRRVWGLLHRGRASEGAYFVEWTLGQVARHGAHIDLVLGQWGAGTTRAERYLVSLEFRRTERGPEFMVIDASQRQVGEELAHRRLSRDEVIGTPLAKLAFDIVDAIWLQDPRIGEIRGAA